MNDMLTMLDHWQLDVKSARARVHRAPTPRERESLHALWLLARGWSAAQVAEALERDAHTIGDWLEDFRQRGLAGVAFEQTGGAPRPLPDGTGGAEGSGPAMREYLATPDPHVRLEALPPYTTAQTSIQTKPPGTGHARM